LARNTAQEAAKRRARRRGVPVPLAVPVLRITGRLTGGAGVGDRDCPGVPRPQAAQWHCQWPLAPGTGTATASGTGNSTASATGKCALHRKLKIPGISESPGNWQCSSCHEQNTKAAITAVTAAHASLPARAAKKYDRTCE
jgi:hypothetical protein